jgi:hypothetical protein
MSTLTADPPTTQPTVSPPSLVSEPLTVYPWTQPRFEQWGHHIHSDYVERFWLPVLGPSSIVLARHIGANFDEGGTAYECDTHTMAASIGTSPSQLVRVIHRLVSFGQATYNPGSRRILALRTHWAPLSAHSIKRLPAHLAELHRETETDAEATHYSTRTERAIWRLVLGAHANGTSLTDLDALLRQRGCEQGLRVELIDWCRQTPRHGRP